MKLELNTSIRISEYKAREIKKKKYIAPMIQPCFFLQAMFNQLLSIFSTEFKDKTDSLKQSGCNDAYWMADGNQFYYITCADKKQERNECIWKHSNDVCV